MFRVKLHIFIEMRACKAKVLFHYYCLVIFCHYLVYDLNMVLTKYTKGTYCNLYIMFRILKKIPCSETILLLIVYGSSVKIIHLALLALQNVQEHNS